MPTGQGKVLPYDMLQIAEGMASSAAFAVAKLGGDASLWSAVGDDQTGERIIGDLAESGMDTRGMRRVAGARSAVSTILIDDAGERLIILLRPASASARPTGHSGRYRPIRCGLVDVRWPSLALQTLLAAREAKLPAILDGDVAPEGVIEMLAPAASHIVFFAAGC